MLAGRSQTCGALAWTRSVPAAALALLALLGQLLQSLHFAAHTHIYCAEHGQYEHANGCGAGHGDGDHDRDGSGDDGDGDGDHEGCPWLPPDKLADPPAPAVVAIVTMSVPAAALPAPAELRHALAPLIMAPKHSPPATA
jgi:hypothetical protein